MNQATIINTIGQLLQYLVGAFGAFFIINGLIQIGLAQASDNPNAKDVAYLKLSAGLGLMVLAIVIPTLLNKLVPQAPTLGLYINMMLK